MEVQLRQKYWGPQECADIRAVRLTVRPIAKRSRRASVIELSPTLCCMDSRLQAKAYPQSQAADTLFETGRMNS